MQVNAELLSRLKAACAKNFDKYLERVLSASVSHGLFGMSLTDTLHSQLPLTYCGNCGSCCNSVSFFSLEYHRIMREIMVSWQPSQIRRLVKSAFNFDLRQAEVGGEKRLRCIFRDEKLQRCLIHPVRPFPCRFFGLLKEGKAQECSRVKQPEEPNRIITEAYMASLQTKLAENSESYAPFEGGLEINFFPFEFWFFKNIFSAERAIQIYKELLVPMSTPLTRLWQGRLGLNRQSL